MDKIDIISKLTLLGGHLNTFILGYFLGNLKKKIPNWLLVLSGAIILSIIGTIWIVSYSINGFTIANLWLLWSLIVGFIYLILDVCHYFFDSCFYRKEYFKFEEEKSVCKHDKRMSNRSRLSYYAICAKFVLLIVTCVLFMIGFINQYNFI